MYIRKINTGNPLRYFFELNEKLLDEYYRQFRNELGYLSEKDKLWINYGDGETGDILDFEETFDEYIEQYLKYNSIRIIEFLYQKIELYDNVIRSHAFIITIRKDLNQLLNIHAEHSKRGKEVVINTMKIIKDEIDNKILAYLELDLHSNTQDKTIHNYNIKKGKSANIRSFIWKGNHFRASMLFLHTKLIRYKFISEETDVSNLIKAFNGDIIENPLNIKWIVQTKDKRHTSKTSILYFLDQLIEKKLMEYPVDDSPEASFYSKISNIFCDYRGKPLQNIKQSNQYYLKSDIPIKSDIINNIVNDLFSEK